MPRSVIVTRSVLLAAPAQEVWAVVSTPAGVNAEMMPLVRMTFPSSVAGLTPDDIAMGAVVCRCWMLAGGVLPFDRHALAFESIAGTEFVEESTSWLQCRWRHERSVVTLDPGRCRVTDCITIEPRVPLARPFVRRIVPLVFEHRHRRLEQRFGAG